MKDFKSLWLIRLQWFMNRQCILSSAQANLATRLWILLKALTGTVLGDRTEELEWGVRDRGIYVLVWMSSLGFLLFP